MEHLFTTLTAALSGSTALALGAAAAWGVLSIVLSPCHLASIPLIIGFIGGQGDVSRSRAAGLASLFAIGILMTIALIGAMTAAAGRIAGDIGAVGNYLVAAVFFVMGLHLLEVIPFRWSGRSPVNTRNRGMITALLMGLAFGVALGPCTFAFMAPMLAIAFKTSGQTAWQGALLLLAYGIGHCGIIALAGTGTGTVQRWLDWNERSSGVTRLRRVCGVLVLLGGLWLLRTAA